MRSKADGVLEKIWWKGRKENFHLALKYIWTKSIVVGNKILFLVTKHSIAGFSFSFCRKFFFSVFSCFAPWASSSLWWRHSAPFVCWDSGWRPRLFHWPSPRQDSDQTQSPGLLGKIAWPKSRPGQSQGSCPGTPWQYWQWGQWPGGPVSGGAAQGWPVCRHYPASICFSSISRATWRISPRAAGKWFWSQHTENLVFLLSPGRAPPLGPRLN